MGQYHRIGGSVSPDYAESINVHKYITIGSPLGVNAIKKHLDVPLKMPSCIINGWYNAFSFNDIVALTPLDKKHFDITPSITNKNNVRNNTKGSHGIEGYLRDKEVALEIFKAVEGISYA